VQELELELQMVEGTYNVELSSLKIERIEMNRRLRTMERTSNHPHIFADYERKLARCRADLEEAQETIIALQMSSSANNDQIILVPGYKMEANNGIDTRTVGEHKDKGQMQQQVEKKQEQQEREKDMNITISELTPTQAAHYQRLQEQFQRLGSSPGRGVEVKEFLPSSFPSASTTNLVKTTSPVNRAELEAEGVKIDRANSLEMLKQARIAMAEQLIGNRYR
jgi:hypothetical protein